MENEKDQLLGELISIREREKEVRDRLAVIDHDEEMTKANKYVGRYYKENSYHKESIIEEWVPKCAI